jgi:hypothetical protein
MGAAWTRLTPASARFTGIHGVPSGCGHAPESLGGAVQDLLYIGLVIVVFAALWLLVKGVERFER